MDNDIVNEIFSIDDDDYSIFLEQHDMQLKSNNIPEEFWKPLCLKLKNQVFDAGNAFSILYVEPEDENEESSVKVVVTIDSVDPSDGNNIYLIDHAWTYKASEAATHLQVIPGLLGRMAKLMNVPDQSETLIDDVGLLQKMWKFNSTYSCPSLTNIEDQLPIWYIMDEFGSSIQHSNNPKFRTVPFLHIPEGIAYSLLFPKEPVIRGDEVTRDYVEGVDNDALRKAHLLPWIPNSFRDLPFNQSEPQEAYFATGRRNETLPNLNASFPKYANGEAPLDARPLKVYSQYSYINQYLTSPKFSLSSEDEDADILWLTSHFKNYKEFSETCPSKFINQFPFECVVTIKDLLAIICRRKSTQDQHETNTLSPTEDTQPIWLPITYNLSTELLQFISYFQHREDNGLDNHWICKPWNLARGMDTLITENLDCIIRISRSGPKIVQKYIHNPALFYRDGIGRVKFDVRYVILLKAVHPLELYIYKNFFLRFANKAFELTDFHDYEKHFTVMNYNENAPLHRLLCSDFIREFNLQNPNNQWSQIEPKIFSMIREIFESATSKSPPCGLGRSPQSRALYAADLMLSLKEDQQLEPRILEINWTPDCQRACEYYPDFYNDIFELLFVDIEKDIFYKVA